MGARATSRTRPWDDAITDAELRAQPLWLREAVPAVRELRVVVIGDAVFAARATIDAHGEVGHEPAELAVRTRGAILAMLRILDLRFGVLEIAETHRGESYLIDFEPNGQWLWLELATGLPLAATMAELLASQIQDAP